MLENNRPHCEKCEDTDPVFDKAWTGRRTWIANITGSDLLPETVLVREKKDGQFVDVEVPNPHRVPTVVSREIDGDQIEARDNEGHMYWSNQPSKVVKIWPFTRRSLPAPIAVEVLGRDAMMRFKGQIVKCPEPLPHEPDHGWDYNDLIDYLYIVDRDASIRAPKSEAAVRKQASAAKLNPELELQVAKDRIIKQIWCRVVAGYNQPTSMSEFNAIRRSMKDAAEEESKPDGVKTGK
jgi:hypothetical protein